MTKNEFIKLYMKNAKINFQGVAKEKVELFIEVLKEALEKDDILIFRDFGTFEKRETKRKEAKNPLTGEIIKITPKKYIKFKVGKELEDRINKPKRGRKKKEIDI